MIIGHVNYIK